MDGCNADGGATNKPVLAEDFITIQSMQEALHAIWLLSVAILNLGVIRMGVEIVPPSHVLGKKRLFDIAATCCIRYVNSSCSHHSVW
jgi:hypothetical protein